MNCEHDYVFQCIVYWSDNNFRPGSGARDRHYGDRFFCRKCLDQRILNDRIAGNDYGKPIEGTFPR